MRNDKTARAFLSDSEIILEESLISFEKKHYHRVIRKCQEATELAIKGLFRYMGLEYPKSHILGRVIKKELSKFNIFSREDLNKIAYISDSLAFDREPSFYGSPEGIPASELFIQEDAKEAIENTRWIIEKIKGIVQEE